MGNQFDLQPIQQNLAEAKNVLILVAANPNLDSLGAGLALYLSFKKQGKNVGIGCPTPMTVAFNRLIGVNKVTDKIGSRNLIISFDYIKDSIEKVSYNIENDKFNLVVEPKPNYPPLDSDKVSYSHTGAEADIVFIVGATKLEDLEKLYFGDKKIFTDKLTVNIDYKRHNTRFGQVNLHNPQTASCSEIVAGLIKSLNLPVDQDIATNLYAGIKTNTTNFQTVNTNASTFEAAAWCIKNGARKNQVASVGQVRQPQFQQPQSQLQPQPQPLRQSPGQPRTQPDAPPPPSFSQQFSSPEDKESKPPPDWFKPKIYKGKNLV